MDYSEKVTTKGSPCKTVGNDLLWKAFRKGDRAKAKEILMRVDELDLSEPLILYAAMGNDSYAVNMLCPRTTNIGHVQNAHCFLLKHKNWPCRMLVVRRYNELLAERRAKIPPQKKVEVWTPPPRPLKINSRNGVLNNRQFMEYATLFIK